jgi:hypothetical protein
MIEEIQIRRKKFACEDALIHRVQDTILFAAGRGMQCL